MVEVDTMPNAVHDGKEQSSKSYNLVEGDSRIKGDILIEGRLPEEGDEVAGHGQQQNRVGPHHTGCSSTCHCHTISSNTTQPSKFSLHRIICK